jgi:hypothetical protein
MEYEKIISVTGLPGLYELVSSKSDGAIVRSLDDKSTKFVSSRIHNFSHLESIEVYTSRENVNLVEVFNAMEANSAKLPDEKDNNGLKKYFEDVYPELDFERVYTSDMKKMVKWFSVLKANNVEIKIREQEEEEEQQPEPVEEPKPKKEKAKEAELKKADKPVKESKEKEPAKKAEKAAPAGKAAKKESEEKKAAPKKKAAAKTESKKETPAKKKAATKKSAKKK